MLTNYQVFARIGLNRLTWSVICRHHYQSSISIGRLNICHWRLFSTRQSTDITTNNNNKTVRETAADNQMLIKEQQTINNNSNHRHPRRTTLVHSIRLLFILMLILDGCFLVYYYHAFYIARSIEKGLYGGGVDVIDMDEFINDVLPSGQIETIVFPVLPDEKCVGIILSLLPIINGKRRYKSDYLLPIDNVEEFRNILTKLIDDQQLKSTIMPFELKTLEEFRYKRVALWSTPFLLTSCITLLLFSS